MEKRTFQADAKQILRLVTHSIYSDRSIFLRELLSNASDAMDKARIVSLKGEDIDRPEEPKITIQFDAENKTITITDGGIGMTEEEIIENLGTIAQSGTKIFSEKLEEGEDLNNLIGQFGVGFYSAFMVADKVEVESKSAHSNEKAIKWASDGSDSYEIGESNREEVGTQIVLHIREDAAEFLEEFKLKEVIKKHSEFVSWPIFLGEDQINKEKALWLKNPKEVTDEEYISFYKHIAKDWQDPLGWIHVRTEGELNFSGIIFIPKKHSFQLDQLNYKVNLQLFQKRVKVLENAEDLLPRYLRFTCGVIESDDVSLNVSREILQQTPAVEKIRKNLSRKVLQKLQAIAKENEEEYINFWKDSGSILKEGLPEESEKRKKELLNLLRFCTTTSGEEFRTLSAVKEDLKEGQDAIWFLTDVNKDIISSNPVLEGFKKREWEVILFSDPVDEWVVMSTKEFEEVPLKSVAHGDFEEEEDEEIDEETKKDRNEAEPLVQWLGDLFESEVEAVRVSKRLTDSPSILINQEGSMGANMEMLLKASNQTISEQKRVLEINPSHPMVKTLARLNDEGKTGLEPFARLLLDHASISEGRLKDPASFVKRLQVLMEKAAANM
jgi:molecular chaperone HtpG